MLRFFALWEDADPNGETTPVTIQYHLVDDTVEINEVYERNCGRFPFPALMHRLKLPKITEASGELQNIRFWSAGKTTTVF